MNNTLSKYIEFVLAMLFLPILYSCSDHNESMVDRDDMNDFVEIVPYLIQPSSRASGIAAVLNEFYVTAYQGTISKGSNIHYTYNGTSWNSDRSIVWPTGTKTISFWGLSQSFNNVRGISNSNVYSSDQYFNFTCDPADSHDLLYASNLNTTKAKARGKVSLGFNYALSYPYFTAVQAIDDVTINIDSVFVHNLRSTGTLRYDKVKNSTAKWTVIDTLFATYGTKMTSVVTLNPNKKTAVRITPSWKWIPQIPTLWKTAIGAPVSIQEADELHQVYVEVRCQIIKDGNYLWGAPSGANEFESVYFPFSTNVSTQGYKKAIKLKFDGGFLADGTPWKPHDLSGEFSIAEWIMQEVSVDPWEEEEPEDLEF